MTALDAEGRDACPAVVLTVSATVPAPPATVLELNEQVGAGVPPPLTLQARLTLPLKPFTGETVIVEVADPPARTEGGKSDDADTWKSGAVLGVWGA